MRLFNVAAIGIAIALAACGKKPPPPMPPPTVGYVVLKTEPVTLTTELPGRVSAMESSDVRPQVSGVVRRRNFAEGSLVHAGQVLYEIEDSPYRAALLSAQGQLAQAQANIRSTQLQADRFRQLVAIDGVSKQDADNAVAAAEQAKAAVVAGRGAVAAAEVNLGFTRIRAPISGRIGRSLFTPGALVQTGQSEPLATIQQMNEVYVDITQSARRPARSARGRCTAATSPSPHLDTARVQLVLPNGVALSDPRDPALRAASTSPSIPPPARWSCARPSPIRTASCCRDCMSMPA